LLKKTKAKQLASKYLIIFDRTHSVAEALKESKKFYKSYKISYLLNLIYYLLQS